MRCTYGWGCDVKVAAPATLLTDHPTPEDSPAQPSALGAIVRDEGAGVSILDGWWGRSALRKPPFDSQWLGEFFLRGHSRCALRVSFRGRRPSVQVRGFRKAERPGHPGEDL